MSILKNSDGQLFLCGQGGAGKSRSVKGPSDEALEHLLMGYPLPYTEVALSSATQKGSV